MKANYLFALIIFTTCNSAFGQGLDKAISSKPTVRSEIARGNEAGFKCQIDNIGKFRQISECALRVVSQNTQQQKSNDAFKLGIYATVLMHWEDVQAGLARSQDPNLVASGVGFWRGEVKRARSILKLTDKEICAAMELQKCDALYTSLARAK